MKPDDYTILRSGLLRRAGSTDDNDELQGVNTTV